MQTILWKRLDVPGHDACRLEPLAEGWRLEGSAVFQHEAGHSCLNYQVDCDPGWITRRAYVRGWIGSQKMDVAITRDPAGIWHRNSAKLAGLQRCLDLDLSFTPATNLLQLRRTALVIGESADVPVAWLDVPRGRLELLEQRYERRSQEVYLYEAPRFGYSGLLELDSSGFVRHYPGLWRME